jgi:hypothetical protein
MPQNTTVFPIVPNTSQQFPNSISMVKIPQKTIHIEHSLVTSRPAREYTMPIIKFISLSVLICCLTVADNIV